MRHRKRGRVLGRSPSHRKALLRNLASSLFLTEVDPLLLDSKPKVKGRIITTLQKAKEVRPLVEKCITIARRAQVHQQRADQYATTEERGSQAWRAWRDSDRHAQWAAAIAPVVSARRRAFRLLRNKMAVTVLFDELADRFADRAGGYTRILRLSKPRLGDAGTRAILEFVGLRDRVTQRAPAPKFEEAEAAATDAGK
jgi:large subunit ribosomal protein L17